MTRIMLSSFIFLAVYVGAAAQKPGSCKVARLNKRMENPDTLYIINLWATWCGPCVAELPEFNRIDSAWGSKPVKVILVSMDFPEAYPVKLREFIEKKQLHPEVLWLDETDANYFIPKISTGWSGSLPATLISCRATSTLLFKESKVSFSYLDEEIRRVFEKKKSLSN